MINCLPIRASNL